MFMSYLFHIMQVCVLFGVSLHLICLINMLVKHAVELLCYSYFTRLWTCFMLFFFTHVWASSQLRSSQCLLWTSHKQWPLPPSQMLQILEFFLATQKIDNINFTFPSYSCLQSIRLESDPNAAFSLNIDLFLNQGGVACGEAGYARSC